MTSGPSRTPTTDRPWPTALFLGATFFLVLFDSLAVATALPAIAGDLRLAPASLPWVVNLYSLGLGGLMLLAGQACNRWGRRHVLIAALALLTAATLLAGIAQSPVLLLIGRALQGSAAAFVLPTVLAMTGTLFPREPWRSRVLAVVLVSGAVSGLTGAVCGGLLTATAGWRWIFLATVPFALVLLAAAVSVLPADRPGTAPAGRPDVPGAILATGGVTLLLLGVGQGEHDGFHSWTTWSATAAGLLLLAAFPLRERRAAHPLLKPGLLRSPRVIGSCLGSAAHSAVYSAGIVVGSLHLQDAYDLSPAEAGLALTPTLVATTLSGTVAARIVRWMGPRTTACCALLLAALSLGLMGANAGTVGYATAVLPWLLLRGLAEGTDYVALTRAAVADAAEEDRLTASSLFEASTHIGGAIAVAVYAALIASDFGYRGAYLAGALFAAAGSAAVLLLPRQDGRPAGAERHAARRRVLRS